MKHRISLLLLTAAILSGPASAEAYKCRTADGRVEIANSPCPSGANTVKSVPDEKISESTRQQAEREANRMREYVEKREAAQRADEAAERQTSQRQAATSSPATGTRSVDDCLRELDQQALQPMQRAQMEAACRGNPQKQPTYVPVPVPVYGGNPIDNCIQNIERMNLSPGERNRRISQCESSYTSAPPPPTHTSPPAAPAASTAKPAGTIAIPCPAGNKNCAR